MLNSPFCPEESELHSQEDLGQGGGGVMVVVG